MKNWLRLFAISQRYYIESNSQLIFREQVKIRYCLLSRKDTTLKAIHNVSHPADHIRRTVCYLAKILHWKQFTTYGNSLSSPKDCLLSRKDTTLKAIHNTKCTSYNVYTTVCYLAKILHWKQFTTCDCDTCTNRNCLLSRKKWYCLSTMDMIEASPFTLE